MRVVIVFHLTLSTVNQIVLENYCVGLICDSKLIKNVIVSALDFCWTFGLQKLGVFFMVLSLFID